MSLALNETFRLLLPHLQPWSKVGG